jgi:hypothetical protein
MASPLAMHSQSPISNKTKTNYNYYDAGKI